MIRLDNVSKVFEDKVVVKDLTLNLPEKGFIGITGKSGSGKTTLLNIISGIVNIDNGNYYINDENTKEFKNKNWSLYRNQFFGFVYQDDLLIENLTIYDNLELPLKLTKSTKEERDKLIKYYLEKVGMLEYINSFPNKLSGGEKQRISIARALINNPSVILADEPTNSLDCDNVAIVMEILKDISKERLVIFVSHDNNLVNKYSDEIINIDEPINNLDNYNQDLVNEKIIKDSYSRSNIIKPVTSYLKNRKLLSSFLITSLILTMTSVLIVLNLMSTLEQIYQNSYQQSLQGNPIVVSEYGLEIKLNIKKNRDDYFPKDDIVHSKDNNKELIFRNELDLEYYEYINKIENDLVNDIFLDYDERFNFYSNNSRNSLASYIKELPLSNEMIVDNYDILRGNSFNILDEGLIVVLNNKNEFDRSLLENLDIFNKRLTVDDLFNIELSSIKNNNIYLEKNNGYSKENIKEIDESALTTHKVKAVIRSNKVEMFETLDSGIYITKGLSNALKDESAKSNIVLEQLNKNYDVITGSRFSNSYRKEDALKVLGYSTYPISYKIYPKTFESKEKIIDYLENYKSISNQKVVHTDIGSLVYSTLEEVLGVTKMVMMIILVVIILAISILLAIIAYFKIGQRKREFIIYQMLGMKNKNISMIIYMEYLVYTIVSAIISIIITLITIKFINNWYNQNNYLQNPFRLNVVFTLATVLVVYIITVITNLIPMKRLINKDLNLVFKN